MALYLAFYINKDDINNVDSPYKAIRMEPATVDYLTSYYMLQSYKYFKYPGFIIQASTKEVLDKFINELKKISHLSLESFISDIIVLIKKYGSSILLMWERWEPIDNTINSAATKMLLPTEKNYPVGMNPRNKALWTHVIRNYRSDIRKYQHPKKQWSTAKILYERICNLNGLTPFITVPVSKQPEDMREQARSDLVAKLKDGYEKGNMLSTAIYDNMSSYGWANGISTKWGYVEGPWTDKVTGHLFKKIELNGDIDYREIVKHLHKDEAFRKVNFSTAELPIGAYVSVVFMANPKNKNEMFLYIKFSLDRKKAAILLGLNENDAPIKFKDSLKNWVTDIFIIKQ